MQRRFADIVKHVAFCNIDIIIKLLNEECGYINLENFIGHVCRTLILSIRFDYSLVVQHLQFSVVRGITRSGTGSQLTRCSLR